MLKLLAVEVLPEEEEEEERNTKKQYLAAESGKVIVYPMCILMLHVLIL